MPTSRIGSEGTGCIFVPSVHTFEHLSPDSSPAGIVFRDGSFLIFKEIFRYDYPADETHAAQLLFSEYSYHYQNPAEQFYFRFDFHPEVGDPRTHPLHHVHARGWRNGAVTLPETPRLPSPSVILEEVLEIIRMNFFVG